MKKWSPHCCTQLKQLPLSPVGPSNFVCDWMHSFSEQSLKQSGNLDEGVFSALDKMEALQNNRAQRWGDKMDRYANERERLAEQLTACFENLEQETGIFLIKPVYSVKGR